MKEENPPLENSDNSPIENPNEDTNNTSSDNEYSKWVDNQGDEVKKVTLMELNMILLILVFQRLFLHIFPISN